MPPEAFTVNVAFSPAVIVEGEIVNVRVSSSSLLPFTVTVAVAVLPLFDLAVMVTVPADLPVTTPPETVAIEESLVDHVIDLFVAFEGETEAERVVVPPTETVADAGLTVTEVTSTFSTFSTIFNFEAALPLSKLI